VDVYSFGILLWEIVSGKHYTDVIDDIIDHSNRFIVVMNVAKGILRPPLEEITNVTLRSLMEQCWHEDADKRPSFRRIRKVLSNEYKKLRVAAENQLRSITKEPVKFNIGNYGIVRIGSKEFVIHNDICASRCKSLDLLLTQAKYST